MKIKSWFFPASTSSVNSNWFPLNCGCFLAHPGCATQLEKLNVTGWGRDTKQRLSWSRDGAVQGALLSPSFSTWSFLPFLFPFFLLPFPLGFPRPGTHWAGTAGVQREVTPGFGLHCHVHRKHRISCFCVSDEAQALGMIVAIYRALWWCNQHKRVATSAVLESDKSIPAFPVPSFICKDACLYFEAQEFPSVLLGSRVRRGVCVYAHICVCQKGGARTLCCNRGEQEKKWVKRHIFTLCKYLAKARQGSTGFCACYISKKCDVGESLISLLVFRCGSCQLETSWSYSAPGEERLCCYWDFK